jgi:hypothetical protein
MMPTEAQVRQFMMEYPEDMIHACAKAAMNSITERDTMWILAAYEMSKPRVINRTVTERLNAKDAMV